MELVAHYPRWELETFADEETAATTLDRIGGTPLGLPREDWPVCDICKRSLRFIGQWQHAPERLDLKGERVAYAFLCANLQCHIHQLAAGAEHIGRVVLAQPTSLVSTQPPADLEPVPAPALLATGWKQRREFCPDEWAEVMAFGLHQTRRNWPATAEEPVKGWPPVTKLGGHPVWIQDPVFQPLNEPSRFRYVAQWGAREMVARQQLMQSEAYRSLEHERGRRGTNMLERSMTVGRHELLLRTTGNEFGSLNDVMFRPARFARNGLGAGQGLATDTSTDIGTALEGGVVYLLEDTLSDRYYLYYLGR